MAGLILDAGALIAAERHDREFWAIWQEAERRDVDVIVPASVVAQVYRGGRSARVAKVLKACVVQPLDDARARRIGVLCGKSRTADVVDAHVVLAAAAAGADVVTPDADEINHLMRFAPGCGGLIRI